MQLYSLHDALPHFPSFRLTPGLPRYVDSSLQYKCIAMLRPDETADKGITDSTAAVTVTTVPTRHWSESLRAKVFWAQASMLPPLLPFGSHRGWQCWWLSLFLHESRTVSNCAQQGDAMLDILQLHKHMKEQTRTLLGHARAVMIQCW